MIFVPLDVDGAYIIETERRADERGYFAREWCATEFARLGLCTRISQINAGVSRIAGTIRGLHFQIGEQSEVKVVRCTRGAAFDVIVDLRSNSPTYRKSFGVEITSTNGRLVYAPEGFAHGYQTLADDTEVEYLTSKPYSPEHARGVRFDDPALRISWPLAVTMLSDQDANWPSLDRA